MKCKSQKNIFKFSLTLSLVTILNLYANALTFTVTNTNASGSGSFAQAILSSNTSAGADIINITATGTTSIASVSIDGPLTINSNKDFIVDGGGSYRQNMWNTDLLVITSSNVTLNNLILQNAKPSSPSNSWEGNGIICSNGLSNIALSYCKIKGCNINGFAISTWVPSGNTLQSKNFTFSNCDISNNGGSGLNLAYTTNLTITSSTFSDNFVHGIYLNGMVYKNGVQVSPTNFANQLGVTNSTIDVSICNNNGGSNSDGGGIVLEGNSDGNIIKNSIFNNNRAHGIWLRRGTDNNQILMNDAKQNGKNGAFDGSSLACGITIALGGNTGNLIKGNVIDDNKFHGIFLYDNYGLTGNNLNYIENNIITNNDQHGISVINSNKTIVRNNLIGTDVLGSDKGNDVDGIVFNNSSSNGEISGNTIVYNKGNGVSINAGFNIVSDFSDPNTILIPKGGSNDNNIFNNYIGIDANGMAKPNSLDGIVLSESFGNNIGKSGAILNAHVNSPIVGIVANTRYKNYISGNDLNGIVLNGIDASNVSLNPKQLVLNMTSVEGNVISFNQSAGVAIIASTSLTKIVENSLFNNDIAIVVDGKSTFKNTITQNSIYCNSDVSTPGIKLSNDGNNNLLNPWISSTKLGLDIISQSLLIGDIDNSIVPVGSVVEIFKKDETCTNCKQGKTYVGSTTVAATSPILGDTKGGFKYNFSSGTTLTAPINCNDYIFTITDLLGNTSQFSTCSECVSVLTGIENDNNKLFELYPNPAQDKLTITTNSTSLSQLEIVNVKGDVVYKKTQIGSQNEINTSDFENGIYFVKIISDSKTEIRKVVILK